jgi:hypothetical protein
VKKKLFIFLVLISAFLAGRHLLRQGLFTMHDDLQVSRLFEMRKCFQDKQIPCRWVPDMGYGYGYPLFNFYPPLPFYIGYGLNLLGFNLIAVTKLLFLIGIIGGGVFMYILGEKIWGEWGGLISAVFYTWAPYKAVDIYVRGALNEFWAMMFFPLIIYALSQVIDHGKKYIPLLSFSFAGLLLSHNGMSMLFAPLMVIWGLGYLLLSQQDFKQRLSQLVLSGIWGVGLAAFFILPAFLEKKYVHVETMLMGYFNYLAHFVSLSQVFINRQWGYGASVWGLEDGMPFQIGILHWLTTIPVLGWAAVKIKKINKRLIFAIGFFFLLFLATVFLAHSRSTFIWKQLTFLEYLQFPWRFLALATFGLSVLSGGLAKILKNQKRLIWIILILVIGLNFNYFTPDKVIKTTVEEKVLSPQGWESLQTDAIFDYLPKSADMPPADPAPQGPITSQAAEVDNFEQGTDWYQAKFMVNEQTKVTFPIFDFPEWQAWVDDQPAEISADEELGRITLQLPEGEHQVFLKLTDTPLRRWSNLISLLSWGGLLVLITQRKWSWLPIK